MILAEDGGYPEGESGEFDRDGKTGFHTDLNRGAVACVDEFDLAGCDLNDCYAAGDEGCRVDLTVERVIQAHGDVDR